MAVSVLQHKSASGQTTSATATLTSTPTNGNLLVMMIATASAATIATPAGWTASTGATAGAGSGGTSRDFAIFWKVASGDSATLSATVANTAWSIVLFEVTGQDTTTPVNILNTQVNASTQTQTTPTVTPTGSGNAIVLGGTSNRGLTVNTWSTEQINSSATGVTEDEDTVGGSTGSSMAGFEKYITGLTGTYAGSAVQSGAASVGAGGIIVINELSSNVTTTKTQTGKSRITINTTQTQLGKARMQVTTPQTILGKSRITVSTPQTQLGKANVRATTTKTQLGKSSITTATAQLKDDFEWGDLDTLKWSTTNAADATQISVSNLYLQISHTALTQYNNIYAVNSYNLTGSTFKVNVTDAGNQALASHEAIVGIQLDSSNKIWFSASGGTLSAFKKVATVQAQVGASITYNASTHAWWRFRESGGTIFWDTSPDGTTWTNRWSVANPFAVIAIFPYLESGCYSNEASSSFAKYDNVNLQPGDLQFSWSGFTWNKRIHSGPSMYNNLWSTDNVSVDGSNNLLLAITNPTGAAPIGAEVYSATRGWGYGTYTCVIATEADTLDNNVVLGGMFTFDFTRPPDYAEIDMGESRDYAGTPHQILFSHTYNNAGVNTFITDSATVSSDVIRTYSAYWTAAGIVFSEYAGVGTGGTLLRTYTHSTNLPTSSLERVHFNFWVQNISSPGAVAPATATIQSFSFVPGTVVTKTQTGKSRITIKTTQTQLGKSRITAKTTQTQTGLSRITVTTTKTQPGKARIQTSVTKTIAGVSRITATTLKTITGLTRITAKATKTQTGLARITATALKTVTGLARVTVSTTKTIQGLSRITITTTRTIVGKARVTASTAQTILGKARVTIITLKTIAGLSRITASATKTQPGKARITASTSQTQLGKSTIKTTVEQTVLGKARITAAATKTIQGLTRVTANAIKTITGLSRITAAATKTQLGKSRITVTTAQTVLGKGDIRKTTTQTQPGRARVQITSLQTLAGKARLQLTAIKTVQGLSRIQLVTLQLITGKARITAATLRTVAGKARLTAQTNQTVTGVARVTITTLRTVLGVARVQLITPRTIVGKSRVTARVSQTIPGRSRIQISATQTVTGHARIQTTVVQAVMGHARLETLSDRTITGQSRIRTSVNQAVTGTARITVQATRIVTGLSRVSQLRVETIQGLALIRQQNQHAQSITGKAHILNKWYKPNPTAYQSSNPKAWEQKNRKDFSSAVNSEWYNRNKKGFAVPK